MMPEWAQKIPVRIRVTKSPIDLGTKKHTAGPYWYANRLGRTYTVIEEYKEGYEVKVGNKRRSDIIPKTDCELIIGSIENKYLRSVKKKWCHYCLSVLPADVFRKGETYCIKCSDLPENKAKREKNWQDWYAKPENKEKHRKWGRIYAKNNSGKYKQYRKRYYQEHPNENKERSKARYKKYCDTHPSIRRDRYRENQVLVLEGIKRCSICNEKKPFDMFSPNPHLVGKRHTTCKKCCNKMHREKKYWKKKSTRKGVNNGC